jgi:hypothetical protein
MHQRGRVVPPPDWCGAFMDPIVDLDTSTGKSISLEGMFKELIFIHAGSFISFISHMHHGQNQVGGGVRARRRT